jgi:acyl carrier protein
VLPNTTPRNKDELRGQCRKIVVETSGVDPRTLTVRTRVADLGFDGVGMIELVMALEDAFDLEIPEGDVKRFATLQDIIDYVAERLAI